MENWQTWTALAIVAGTITIFTWRWIKKRRGGGSGGGCNKCG